MEPMPARYLILNPCEDACGTLTTDRTVEGAPVYLCPGCGLGVGEDPEEARAESGVGAGHAHGSARRGRAWVPR